MTEALQPLRPTAMAMAPANSAERGAARRLHLGHFAFMRAVLQGIDALESWNRYLRLPGDPDQTREVRKTIQWIRDEFAAAARRFSRHGMARLVLIDAGRIVERQEAVPSLDEFADQHALQDFSYAEQLERYEDHYGKATRRQSRRSRLLAKQLEALQWLEGVAVTPPQPDDPVAAWLHPDLAARLEQGGISTLRQLIERINGVGQRWWVPIPAIGAGKAERIVSWLRQQQSALKLSLGVHVEKKHSALTVDDLLCVVPRAVAIVPLDKLIIPHDLDGTFGRYRMSADACLLQARNDRDAVLEWLDSKSGGALTGTDRSHTRRAYLKEAERFILWSVVQQKIPLSSMTTEDCLAYCRFLEKPSPTHLWCGTRSRGKWSPLWRPFEGGLSIRAQRQAITILKNLYKYLSQQRYLTFNAWQTVALPEEVKPRVNKARSFSSAQWQFIERTLENLPETSANRRLKLALPMMYATGLRLAEAVAARVGDLHPPDSMAVGNTPQQGGWQLNVAGQGVHLRRVAMPEFVMRTLSDYLVSRGLPADPMAAENREAAILGKVLDVAGRAPWSAHARHVIDPKAGIAPGTLYDQVKEFFALCSDAIPDGDVCGKRAFASASTQWLRHTHYLHRTTPGEAETAERNTMLPVSEKVHAICVQDVTCQTGTVGSREGCGNQFDSP